MTNTNETKLWEANGQPTRAYWERYSAIITAIKAAGFAHPMSADTHAMVRLQGRTPEELAAWWGQDRLNRR